MAYRERSISFEFDELGDGCKVVIRNPRLHVRAADLERPTIGADGQVDIAAATRLANKCVAQLVVEWTMWDAETDEELPVPHGDADIVARAPEYVVSTIMREVNALINPQRPQRAI